MTRLLSIVVPCHNEEGTVGALHHAVSAEVQNLSVDVEFIFVDDGSSDHTLRVLAALSAQDRRVRALSFSRNFGKEAAMLAGLRAARGDAVLIMDADLQHPPSLIPRLVTEFEHGADQVVARRTRAGDPALRTALSRAYYWLFNRLVDVPLEDGCGDFRLVSRRVVDAMTTLPEVNRFSKGLFSWVGYRTVVVDYANETRAHGASTWTMRSLLHYGIDGIISFNNRPLRMSIWLGMASVALAACYVLWLAYDYIRHGVDAPGYLTTVAVIVFLGGIQLICLGILGEYLGRIYYETKSRPAYLIAQEMGRPGSRMTHTQVASSDETIPAVSETSSPVAIPEPLLQDVPRPTRLSRNTGTAGRMTPNPTPASSDAPIHGAPVPIPTRRSGGSSENVTDDQG